MARINKIANRSTRIGRRFRRGGNVSARRTRPQKFQQGGHTHSMQTAHVHGMVNSPGVRGRRFPESRFRGGGV